LNILLILIPVFCDRDYDYDDDECLMFEPFWSCNSKWRSNQITSDVSFFSFNLFPTRWKEPE
jgi:hypothetical protein